MTPTGAVILSGIVTASTLFAALLAWGEYQTHGSNQNLRQKHDGVDEPNVTQSKPCTKQLSYKRSPQTPKGSQTALGRVLIKFHPMSA